MRNINLIPIFTAIVEQGSFSRAAEHLGISKSAVSKRISTLEAEIGVKVLHRSTRKLTLTEAGERFYFHAQQALNSAKEAMNAVSELQQNPKGTLKISTPMSFGRLHLVPLIPIFLKKYPDITIQMDMSDLDRDIIQEGYDIAIRGANLPDSSLIAKKIAPARSVICGAPEYFQKHGIPSVPEELTQHNCILYTYHTTLNIWVFCKDGEEQKVQIKGNYQVNNAEAIRDTLIQGLGIGRIPSFVAAPAIAEGKLIQVLADYEMPTKTIYALYPAKEYMPMKTRAFLDFLNDSLGSPLPYWDRTLIAPNNPVEDR